MSRIAQFRGFSRYGPEHQVIEVRLTMTPPVDEERV
jgi:hypothetical protein